MTAPYSPTTTGKVERWHKTLRLEFLNGKVFADIETAQIAVDQWVCEYNDDRPHQGIGGSVPWERFRLSQTDQPVLQVVEASERSEVLDPWALPIGREGAILLSPRSSAPFRTREQHDFDVVPSG